MCFLQIKVTLRCCSCHSSPTLALAIAYNWPLCQLDVECAFLHGDLLGEAVFITQPQAGLHQPHEACSCVPHNQIHLWPMPSTSGLV